MNLEKLFKWVISPFYLVIWALLIIIALGNISAIIIVFLLAPISLLKLIRDIFPNTGQEIVIKFVFSWYDLIFYVPATILSLLLIAKVVYPFSKLVFINFVVWPVRETFKKK